MFVVLVYGMSARFAGGKWLLLPTEGAPLPSPLKADISEKIADIAKLTSNIFPMVSENAPKGFHALVHYQQGGCFLCCFTTFTPLWVVTKIIVA